VYPFIARRTVAATRSGSRHAWVFGHYGGQHWETCLKPGSLVLRHPDDRDLADGRTENDRWVFAVYVNRPRGRIRVLTARDMTEGERRVYQRKRRERS
jgi:uncharacterized DUF497 family protein